MKSFEFLSEAVSSSNIYTVKSGDSLQSITQAFDTTVNGILWQNPQFATANDIMVGSRLRVPGTGSGRDNQPAKVSGNTSPEFNKKLQQIADKLGINFNDLYKIIKFESAGSFSPSMHDPNNVSVGLIGFTEPTAKQLGTSKAELGQMSAEDQLDYVYRYYKMVGAQPGDDVGTLYMRTFMPAFVNSPDNTVLGQKGGGALILPSGKSTGISMDTIWLQNPAFGKSQGKDFFTVGDVKNAINSR
jgi:LysM domain